jgi:hypothetical protein
MSEQKNKLNDVIVNTVDEELKKIFGETAALVIYGYLEDNLSLRREKIPEQIGLFSQGLDKFFGSGAYMLEKTILANLYSSFGFNYKEKKGYAFVDYINELKNHLLANNCKHL